MGYLSREAMMFYGVIATLIVAIINLRNSKGDRYIDSINAERVNWINKIRELFSEYDKIAYIMGENIDKGTSKINENGELYKELIYYNNHIELFLNPTEVITKEIIKLQDTISNNLLYDDPTKIEQLPEELLNLHYLQQVVLKSEWKRIKRETKKGKEIRKEDLRDIYIEIAITIDSDRYEQLLKVAFEEEANLS